MADITSGARATDHPTKGLPPGPPFRLWQTVEYLRNPYTMLRRHAKRYGNLFTVRTSRLVVMTGRPDLVRKIVLAPLGQYGVLYDRGSERVLGTNGTTLYAGKALRRERRITVPPFQGKALEPLGGMIREATLEAFSELTPGEDFTVRDPAMQTGLDVIIRTVFGAETPQERAEFRKSIRGFSDGFGRLVFFLPAALGYDKDSYPPYKRFAVAKDDLSKKLQYCIERARSDTGPAVINKVVSGRYDDGTPMSDTAVRDNMIMTLIAGHETSVISLCWGLYWLHRNERCLNLLLDELAPLGPDADPVDYAHLPYLDAVVKEVLRIWPVVTDISRRLAEPMVLGDYEIPPGTNVSAASAILHYDPDLYPNPEEFRPERFLERKFGPHEYIPFGGGERMCPGSQFSVFELKIALATLLTRYRFTLLEDRDMTVKRIGLMGPSTGVRMRFDGPRTS